MYLDYKEKVGYTTTAFRNAETKNASSKKFYLVSNMHRTSIAIIF